jgi:hypothetical protein
MSNAVNNQFSTPAFVRVIKVHGVQTNDCDLARNDLDRVIGSSSKYLIGWEGNERTPYP